MHQPRRVFSTIMVAAVVVLTAAFTIGGGRTFAQDSGSPTAMAGMEAMHDHPAHIHSGTCDTLGDVVYPLTNLTAPDMSATPTAGMMATPMATGMGEVVAQSTTTVQATLEEILGAEHAINVHESPENIGTYIACGDLTGTATGDQLQIELKELNGSGYQGQAMLMDNGDGTTTVTVMLMMTDTMGSPVAS